MRFWGLGWGLVWGGGYRRVGLSGQRNTVNLSFLLFGLIIIMLFFRSPAVRLHFPLYLPRLLSTTKLLNLPVSSRVCSVSRRKIKEW